MSARWLAAVATVCVPLGARAEERRVSADVAPVAPFDAAQLVAAIRIRVAPEGAPIAIRVSGAAGGVRIEAGGAAREVVLGGLTGAAAARLVALAADDLLLDDLAIVPITPTMVRPHEPRALRRRPTIGVLGSAAGWQYALGSLGVDVAIPRGRWLVALDASGGTLVEGPLRLTAAVVRIGGGARVGPLELRGGATFAPVLVSDGAQDRTVLAGGSLSARVGTPITDGVRAVVAGGVDVFATRTTYVLHGAVVMATPRTAPWIAAGVEITP